MSNLPIAPNDDDSLVLSSQEILVDETGKITFLDPEILDTIAGGRLASMTKATANNYGCGNNIYRCGKALA